jgi:hypothetical protein
MALVLISTMNWKDIGRKDTTALPVRQAAIPAKRNGSFASVKAPRLFIAIY